MTRYILPALLVLSLLAVAFAGGCIIGEKRAQPRIETQVDTLTISDTITREKPVFIENRIIDTVLYSVYVPEYIHDTIRIPLPIEQKVYEDSTYRAVVSGWRPSLDTISVYQRTQIVTKTQTVSVPVRKHWGVGVQAGYGISSQGLVPYVGIGLSYNLLQF